MLVTPVVVIVVDVVDAFDAVVLDAFGGCGVVLVYWPFIVVRIGLNETTLLLFDDDKEGWRNLCDPPMLGFVDVTGGNDSDPQLSIAVE